MTNALELDIAIKRSGYSKRYLAKALNISLQTLYNKLNNSVEFKASEIVKLCDILKITQEQRDEIFFVAIVDN